MSNPRNLPEHILMFQVQSLRSKQTYSEMSNAPSFIRNMCDSVSLNMSVEISECLEDACFSSLDLELNTGAPESLSHTSEAIPSSHSRSLTKDQGANEGWWIRRSFSSEKSVNSTFFSFKWIWSKSKLRGKPPYKIFDLLWSHTNVPRVIFSNVEVPDVLFGNV